MIVNNKICDPDSSRNTIALLGQPGVGKTAIVRTLARVLGIPFYQISLGGIKDSAILDGHDYTYTGAQCGRIAKAMQKMGCCNGIIFFDEFDKIGDTERGQEVSDLLLHVTDFTQNSEFVDNFLDLKIDLSKVWFIFSLNYKSKVDPVLLNRMKLIEVPGYEQHEKVQIIQNYVFPKLLKEQKMDQDSLILTREVAEYLIEKVDREKGVRNIERAAVSIVNRVNVLRAAVLPDGTYGDLNLSYAIPGFKLPWELRKEDIDTFLKNKEDKNPSIQHMYL